MKRIAMAGLLVALAGIFVPGCGKGKTAEASATTQPSAVPVKVVAAQSNELQRSVRVVGTLLGLESATLSNRVTGTVGKIYADVGDRVEPGAKLLEIIPQRFELWKQQAEATLSETQARLGVNLVPGEVFDVNQTSPVKMAQSEYDNAKNKYDRQKPLHEQGVIKDFEFIDTESAYKVAASKLENSRDEAKALVAKARQQAADLEIKKKDLRDATIVAPDGSTPTGGKITSYAVNSRRVSAGEYIKEGTPLFTLVADGVLKLQARVPERKLGEVKLGQPVKFKVEAYPGETFEGKISRIDPAVDEANRTFSIEALVENAGKYEGRLRPGSFVQGEVLTRKDADRVMVPLEAVTSFVGVTKVYVAEGDVVHAVEITTGQQDSGWVEIATVPGQQRDVKPGDMVVYDGVTKLVDGGKVQVKK